MQLGPPRARSPLRSVGDEDGPAVVQARGAGDQRDGRCGAVEWAKPTALVATLPTAAPAIHSRPPARTTVISGGSATRFSGRAMTGSAKPRSLTRARCATDTPPADRGRRASLRRRKCCAAEPPASGRSSRAPTTSPAAMSAPRTRSVTPSTGHAAAHRSPNAASAGEKRSDPSEPIGFHGSAFERISPRSRRRAPSTSASATSSPLTASAGAARR